MNRRLPAVCGMLLAAALLAGCLPPSSQNIGDLLRAPVLAQGQAEIQRALSAHLGAEPQYIFPKQGAWSSPLRRIDLDNDGRDEAVLMYKLNDASELGRERGDAAYMAVLTRSGGEWVVAEDVRGFHNDVASLDVVDLLGNGTRQLVIGYTTATLVTKTLGVYSYGGGALSLVHRFDYSYYALGDFTGRGGTDLAVVGSNEQQLMMQVVPTRDGAFVTEAGAMEAIALDENFVNCVNIVQSVGEGGARLLVVDCEVPGKTLSSQLVYYTGERFYAEDPARLRGLSSRISPLLKSRDINGDGIAETPVRSGTSEITTPAADKHMEYVEWKDFTQAEPVTRQIALLDSDRSVCVSLPDAWGGAVAVTDGKGKGEWRLQSRQTLEVLIEMRYFEGEAPPAGAVRAPGSTGSYLIYGGGLSAAERDAVSMTVMG